MPQFVRSGAGHIRRLQRAKTAREAIATMGSLVTEFGYASDGESFAIADGNEAWLMEMVGKGKEETGFSRRRTVAPHRAVALRQSRCGCLPRRCGLGCHEGSRRIHHRDSQPGEPRRTCAAQ